MTNTFALDKWKCIWNLVDRNKNTLGGSHWSIHLRLRLWKCQKNSILIREAKKNVHSERTCTMSAEASSPPPPGLNGHISQNVNYYKCIKRVCFLKRERTWLIKLFEFGSTKNQRQINAANPDARNKIKTISAFLPCQTHISLFPTAYSIFPSSWLNIFFLNNITLWESSKIYTFKILKN